MPPKAAHRHPVRNTTVRAMYTNRHADDLVVLNVRLPEAVLVRLEETARREGRRLPDLVDAIVELGLDVHNGQEVRRAA